MLRPWLTPHLRAIGNLAYIKGLGSASERATTVTAVLSIRLLAKVQMTKVTSKPWRG